MTPLASLGRCLLAIKMLIIIFFWVVYFNLYHKLPPAIRVENEFLDFDFFQGFVTTAPGSSVDIVPIELMCDNNKLFHENNFNVEEFKILWTSIQKAIDSMKNFTPNALKYQNNFSLLIQEVLQGSSHLLSDDENHFLGIYSKLFIISYPVSCKLFLVFYGFRFGQMYSVHYQMIVRGFLSGFICVKVWFPLFSTIICNLLFLFLKFIKQPLSLEGKKKQKNTRTCKKPSPQ